METWLKSKADQLAQAVGIQLSRHVSGLALL